MFNWVFRVLSLVLRSLGCRFQGLGCGVGGLADQVSFGEIVCHQLPFLGGEGGGGVEGLMVFRFCLQLCFKDLHNLIQSGREVLAVCRETRHSISAWAVNF